MKHYSRLLLLAWLPSIIACKTPSTNEGMGGAPPADPPPPADCAAGWSKDDGDPDTGYGFIPSAKQGIYVQQVDSEDLPSRDVSRVCVCWLRSTTVDALDFEVVFYQDIDGQPANEPYAAVAARADEIPQGVPAAGRFWPVDISDVTLPEGLSYVGVRWNPGVASFVFVCTDYVEAVRGPAARNAPRTPVFFREDRAPGWKSVFDARDPIFARHRAIMLRLETEAR